MNCPACGNAVAETDQFCPKCYARLEPPGLWRKFLSWLAPSGKSSSVLKINVTKNVSIKTSDKDGQHHEYHSLEEAPPELRAEIEKLETEALKDPPAPGVTVTRKTFSTFKIQDASGNEKVYHSLDEMPPEIRAAIEEAQKKSGFDLK